MLFSRGMASRNYTNAVGIVALGQMAMRSRTSGKRKTASPSVPPDLHVSERERGGRPAWEYNAKLIIDAIHAWLYSHTDAIGIPALGGMAERGAVGPLVALHALVRIYDLFQSKLIDLVEQKSPLIGEDLRELAGRELVDRIQFTSTQQEYWSAINNGFKKRRAEFGDRRGVRAPLSHLGWLAGDYLRALMRERLVAQVLLLPLSKGADGTERGSVVEFRGYPEERVLWLKKLCALADFGPDSAREWAQVVFERMQQDEEKILNSPEMRKCKPRPDIADRRSEKRYIVRSGKLSEKDNKHRGRNGKVRLYQFQSTIVDAVLRLASKPPGSVRGITRPI
jgi:hypothetical protein